MIYEELPGDMFEVEADFYAHACNCIGAWGAGVAAVFARKFPDAYRQYRKDCQEHGAALLGTAKVYNDVLCLFTSVGCGTSVSSNEAILAATKNALEDFKARVDHRPVIVAPRFNSGLFGVPWPKTRDILFDVLGDCDIVWKTRYF